jgi:hypothetical protein
MLYQWPFAEVKAALSAKPIPCPKRRIGKKEIKKRRSAAQNNKQQNNEPHPTSVEDNCTAASLLVYMSLQFGNNTCFGL